MNPIIFTVLLVASVNCQSPAFDSFMSRNRDVFSGVASTSPSQSSQPLPQWQQPAVRPASFGRSLTPSVNFAPSEPSPPFVTSNSHIQAFNPPQQQPQNFLASSGTPTTISGPNFQTSISLPALPALPQHPAGSPAALAHQQHHQHQNQQLQLQQQQSFQPSAQPQAQSPLAQSQLTQQFSTHVHNHQIPSSSPQQLANQPSFSPFFNSQGNFPFNFPSQSSAPLSFPTPPSTPPTVPQSLNPFTGFSGFQSRNNFFNPSQQFQSQPQPQPQQSAPLSSFNLPSTTIKAPGFETTFVFMRPSEQPAQGSSLSKVIRDSSGIEKQMFYVPMPNYSPPSVYNTQIVHANPQQQQQQGQQQ